MLKVIYTKITGSLTADISNSSVLLPIDNTSFTAITNEVNFSGGEWTYLLLENDSYSEEVKVTGASGTNLVIVRATSGSTAQYFASLDTKISNSFRNDAVKDIIIANPPVSSLTVNGSGIATADTVGNNTTVNVPAPNFQSDGGIAITGGWPDITFSAESDGGCGCCGGEGGSGGGAGGVSQLTIASSILQGQITGQLLKLILNTPIFTGSNGITVSGAWPNYTIEYGGATAAGTVTSVAVSSGLSVTGDPTVNPTISLTNTGVTAGVYGDVTINAKGQITALGTGFNPISDISITGDGVTATRTGHTIDFTVNSAAVGAKGVIELADANVSIDRTNTTDATPPKLVVDAIAKYVTLGGTGTQAGEADGDYTNVLTSTITTIEIDASKKALVLAEATVLDSTTPTTPVEWGLAVFDSVGTKIYSAKKIAQIKQTAVFVIDGPQTSVSIQMATTALPSGSSLVSKQLRVVTLNA